MSSTCTGHQKRTTFACGGNVSHFNEQCDASWLIDEIASLEQAIARDERRLVQLRTQLRMVGGRCRGPNHVIRAADNSNICGRLDATCLDHRCVRGRPISLTGLGN